MKRYIQKDLLLLIVILATFAGKTSIAQLSGEYSIGNSNADFESFEDAIAALKTEALASDVIFDVAAGNYSNIDIIDIENPGNFNIEFVYKGDESDSASIQGRLKVVRTPFVTFSNFTFYPSANQDFSCILSDESPYFKLNNCRIINLYNNDFDYNEALIKIEYPWEGPYLVTNIDSCLIISEQQTFYIGGKKGSSWFRNNIIYGSIVNKKNRNRLSQYRHFIGNTFYASDYDFEESGQSFHSNIFYYDGIFTFNVQGDAYFNEFHCNVDLRAGDIIGNVFYGDLELKWQDNSNFYNNKVYGELRSVFSDGIKIISNYLYGKCSFNNDNTKFGNNFVFDTVVFSQGPGQMIFHNNFGYNAYLEMNFTGGSVKNNNISNMNIWQPSVTDIENNNFIHLGEGQVNTYGTPAFFYKPFYISDSILYSTNPSLTRKGVKANSYFKYDIDSVLRKNPPTIGANEICFDWEFSDIEIKCSDSLNLDLCIDSLTNLYWSPSYLFNDTTSPNPVIYPEISETIYLMNLQQQKVDSLKIKVGESKPVANASYTHDGLLVSFENLSLCADSYIWKFGDGESSTEESPVHEYKEGGTYQCVLKASNEIGDSHFSFIFEIVSVNENTDINNSISIYPNPATSSIFVESIVLINEISIYNLQGNLIYNELTNNTKKREIILRLLPKGFYMLRIKTKKGIVSKKIIISR